MKQALVLCIILLTAVLFASPLKYKISNNQVTITACGVDTSGHLEIPAFIEGKPVTKIGKNAFFICSRLTSVTIPNSVTVIGDRAFWKCSSLTSVTIPDSVTVIGDRAFSYCYGLTSVTISESVTAIEDRAFYECSGLQSVLFKGAPPAEEEGDFPEVPGYYLPEHAQAWQKVLGGPTGEWADLKMQPAPEAIVAQERAAAEAKARREAEARTTAVEAKLRQDTKLLEKLRAGGRDEIKLD